MKNTLAIALMCLAPCAVMAQAAPAAKSDAKPAAKPAAKKAAPSSSRAELKSATNQVATGIMAAEAALSPEEVKMAERVYTGKLPCELGAFVTIEADAKSPGYFNLSTKTLKYRMFPVASRTGAIRLEDQRLGVVWLQLANKSMLMDQKAGKRLADECMSPEQTAVAEQLKINPAPSLLDAPVAAKAAAAAAAASSPPSSVQMAPLPSAPTAITIVPAASAAAPSGVPALPAAPASAAQ